MCKKKIIRVSVCRLALIQKCFPRAMAFYGKRILGSTMFPNWQLYYSTSIDQLLRLTSCKWVVTSFQLCLRAIVIYFFFLASGRFSLSDSVSGHDPWSRTASLLTGTSQVVTYQYSSRILFNIKKIILALTTNPVCNFDKYYYLILNMLSLPTLWSLPHHKLWLTLGKEIILAYQ